jgi:hypothetical protein
MQKAVGISERIKVCSRSNPFALPWTKIINSLIGFEAGIWVAIYHAVKNPDSRLFQKGPDARRAKNRRAEAYLLIRWSEAIERNDSRWAFFNSLS